MTYSDSSAHAAVQPCRTFPRSRAHISLPERREAQGRGARCRRRAHRVPRSGWARERWTFDVARESDVGNVSGRAAAGGARQGLGGGFFVMLRACGTGSVRCMTNSTSLTKGTGQNRSDSFYDVLSQVYACGLRDCRYPEGMAPGSWGCSRTVLMPVSVDWIWGGLTYHDADRTRDYV